MTWPFVDPPQSLCLAGVARRDITPPVGIYHRMWGAARQDRANGVHRPLLATALALAATDDPRGAGPGSRRLVWVAVDHCLLWAAEMDALRQAVCRSNGLAPHELLFAFSHTHAAGLMDPSRAALPGGELIAPYLARLAAEVSAAVGEALARLEPACISYGYGRCNVAAQRDFFDAAAGQYVCGFNPAGEADDTLVVAQLCRTDGAPLASVVNYACHPTTLAWENALVSPDYIGALREVVEGASGAPCVFLQGASGDLGPRDGYTGEVAIADRIGTQLGHAALAVLSGLPREPDRLAYGGPVVSGALLGVWRHEPPPEARRTELAEWRATACDVQLPYRPGLPTLAQTEAEMAQHAQAEEHAHEAGDLAATATARANVERMRRQRTRLAQLPPGERFPLPVALARLGDAVWVAVEGEHYQYLQRELRARLADRSVIVATNVNGWRPSYLPTAATYGRGIYQEQIAVLAPGSLERLADAIVQQAQALAPAAAPVA